MDTLTKPGEFFLGRLFDQVLGKGTEKPILYEADDLTTHAVVVGMTGSGKTGLCIGLLEEAALDGVPALMIDPKGDLTNLLLHFPELRSEDFQPWVNPDLARREGISTAELASREAANWSKGLADWGITSERLATLKESVQFTIFTPGSNAGLPVSILASLKAPEVSYDSDRELFREKISGTVTALLGLVGLKDIDPVRSREHILLSNIFENAWKAGQDLSLGELILQTQTPPFQKLGVFDVNTFYPQRERFELAMQLNNILAAPSFEAWIEGEPLDIASLLYTPEGRPRHSVFYIAHLNDDERMFFVTLLFSSIEAWMRSQAGTPSLRSLIYFDEIYGYLPPVANPASKPVMLRMLKQARAFGVGLVLATQNPSDVDYKGLSNTGTWFIGKLQTEQDKNRLLDGLQGAMTGGFDRSQFDRMISGLGKRVFLLHNVHEKGPVTFSTRWAMNYLAGPLTRTQIPELNRMAGVTQTLETAAPAAPAAGVPVPASTAAPTKPRTAKGKETKPPVASVAASSKTTASAKTTANDDEGELLSLTRPALPATASEYFLPANLSFGKAFKASGQPMPDQAQNMGLVYRPALLAQASVRFLDRRYNLNLELAPTALVQQPDPKGMLRWEDHPAEGLKLADLESQPEPQARFAMADAPYSDTKMMTFLKKDFAEWVFRSSKVVVRANETLKVYAGPEIGATEFHNLCVETSRRQRQAEVKKVEDSYHKRILTLKEKITREQREMEQDKSEFDQRKLEEWGTHAENILGLFAGRKRRITSSLTKRRMTAQAKADVKESEKMIEQMEVEVKTLEAEQEAALKEINDRFDTTVEEVSELSIAPLKKDIIIEAFGLAWFPYYLAQVNGEKIELSAFSPD